MHKTPAQAEKKRIALRRMPDWMPEEIRASLRESAGATRSLRCCSSFSEGERKAMSYSPPMPISQWAEKYRVLLGGSIPGRWKNVFTPYLRDIMDASNMPGVETSILCKSPQTGGSEAGHNLVGYCIDRLPGPVMYVFPDENTARENSQDRIIPMIKSSPRLSKFLSRVDADTSSLRIKLVHMNIFLGWSGSVSRLGNKPIRVLVLDELDKYQDSKNEARAEDLAEKRTITWRSRKKIFKISTPTVESGPIWQAFTREANARFRYYVRCPHCGEFQLMTMEGLHWPGKDTPEEAASGDVLSQRLAWYVCKNCGSCWKDADRDRAVRKGEWREEVSGAPALSYIADKKPMKVGWHIPAFISYFVSLSEIASVWLKWKEQNDITILKDFQNNYAAEPWAEQFEEREEAEILRLCDDRPRGAVPSPLPQAPDVPRISCLLAGVDTQKGHFRYVIRAFGYGENEESWLVACGAAQLFSDLEELFFRNVYRDADGREYHVQGVMIDAMGNRTREVYAWAAKWRNMVFPWQGKRSMSSPYSMSPLEYFPGKVGQKVKIPGGLTLFQCDTTFFKSHLAHKLTIEPEDPGAFHLHSNDDGRLNAYAKEMCAETWDEQKMAWVNPLERPNHYWDCEVMCAALAYIKNVRHIPLPGQKEEKKVQITRPKPQRQKFGRY